jgi:hypothetical protein
VLVLCTGMRRSGSTWSFNVVKQLLARTSSAVQSGAGDLGDLLRRQGAACEHVIFKTHAPEELGRALIKQRACRTVFTYREPLDSILSGMETFGDPLDTQIDGVKNDLDVMRFQVEAGGVLCVWYGDIVERTHEVVQAIADYLALALPADAVADVATMLSRDNVRRVIAALGKSAAQSPFGRTQWDIGTLFSRHHVRAHPSDPAQVFSAGEIAQIAGRLNLYVGSDATLRPEIRALGMLDNAPLTITRWPEPVAPAPVEAVSVEAPPVEVPPVEAPPIEAPPAEAPPAVTAPGAPPPVAPAAAAPQALAVAAEPLPAELAAEPPEAPSIDATPQPPQAPPAAAVSPPAKAPPVAAAREPAPRRAAYDPVRDVTKKVLARDLLRSLGRIPMTKPGSPGSGR